MAARSIPLLGGLTTMSLTPDMAKVKRRMVVERGNGLWKINGTT